jgi:hypothetical protein
MKRLYRTLVALHPPAFRSQFGAEMELIFEESGRPAALLADALLSLARQWLLRSQIWIVALAALGGTVPFMLAFGIIQLAGGELGFSPVMHRHLPRAPVHAVSPPVAQPFIMLTAVIAILFISGTMIFAITWFRYSERRHSRQMRRA